MNVLSSITACLVVALALWHIFPAANQDSQMLVHCDVSAMTCADNSAAELAVGLDSFQSLEGYVDADYGFSMAVPVGWNKIVYDEFAEYTETDIPLWSEPGYAVGFESPRSYEDDRFADYILIEVLPGDDTGLFASTHDNQRILEGTDSIYYDRLLIDSERDEAIDVDLVIFQRGVQALGYTVSFYAIGEPANEQVLFDAFQIMLRTFSQSSEPFVII